jgi:uncharacterized phage protein gp47/JayE
MWDKSSSAQGNQALAGRISQMTKAEAQVEKTLNRYKAARKAAETRAWRAKPENKAAVAALLAELMGE